MLTKITNAELKERGATTLPNQPKISATALKQEFDAPAKEIVAPAFNRLIDELEAETAAASLGMVAPTGRTGTTVQEVVENIALDLSHLEGSVLDPIVEMAHTHENKELLDTYTQDDEDIADAISKAHSHENKTVLDKLGEDAQGKATYDGVPIASGAGTGDMQEADYDPQETVKDAGGIVSYVTSQLPDVSGKADKVSNATSGNFAGLDNNGNLTDSGSKASDFLTSVDLTSDVTGVLPIANGGTGNSGGYIRTGQKSGTTIGSYATAEGVDTTAIGNRSHAEGHNTTASGSDSHAEGVDVTASGSASHAEGNSTKAPGNASHAEGFHTEAGGNYSHSEGYYTISHYPAQHVSGKYNDNKSTTLLEIGNGADNARSNAFEVYSNGDINFTGDLLKNGSAYHDSTKADASSLASVATSGSYSDLSNKPDLDSWTSEVTVSSSQAVFDNLDDSLGYKLVAEDTLVGITAISKTTGTETGTVKMTYTLVGATNGTTKCKLRILR